MSRSKKSGNSKLPVAIACIVLLMVCIGLGLKLSGQLPQFRTYGFDHEIPDAEQQLRLKLVETASSWIGSNEANGSHQAIIDLYNNHEPLAQGYRVKYDDQWCATFVSAAAIEAGLTPIIPTECGCQRQIELFQGLEVWQEADDYIPLPGDIIYYCQNNIDNINDCTGWSDHVGIVVGTSEHWIKVIEGNYSDRVGYRYIKADDLIIRGYAVPDYSSLCE